MKRPTRSRRAANAFLSFFGHVYFAPLWFALLATIFLGDALLSGGTYLLRDVLTFHHPWQSLVRESIHAGRLPLWNHDGGCGLPLLANLQSGVFYPPHWLGWVLPFDRALTIELALHLALGGILMHSFLRRVGIGGGGAFLGGLGFGFGTWMLAFLESPMKLGSAIWLPLLWTGVWEAMRHGRRRGLAIAALALALSCFAGYPHLVLLQLASAALFALALLPGVFADDTISIGAKLRRVVALPIAGLLAFAVAGVQLLPAREMIAQSSKVANYPPEAALSRSLPVQGLFGAVDPFFLGFPGIDRYWGGDVAEFPFGAFYVGALAVPLAGVAAIAAFANLRELADVKGRRRRRLEQKTRESTQARSAGSRPALVGDAEGASGITASLYGASTRPAVAERPALESFALFSFLSVGFVLATLVALGRHVPLSAFLADAVPGYGRLRWPSTAGFLMAAHLAALAAIGFDTAFRGGTAPKRLARVILGFGVVAIVVSLAARGPLAPALRALQTAGAAPHQLVAYDAAHGAWLETLLVRGALLLAAGAAALLLAQRARLVAFLWIVAVALDLFAATRALDLPIAKGFYDSVPPATTKLREELAGRRMYTPRSTDQLGNFLAGSRNPVAFQWAQRMMLCNANLPAGIAQANGCDPLAPRRQEAFAQVFEDPSTPWEIKERVFDLWNAAILLNAEGVSPLDVPKLTTADAGFAASRHEPRLGRATLLSGWETSEQGEDVLGRLFAPDNDPLRMTILEAAPGESLPAERSHASEGPGEVLAVDEEHGRIRVAWQMGRAGMLRVLETWAPGWRATVNGSAVPVHRADFLFFAIPVPDGPCEVVLEYRPTSVRDGAILTLLGCLVLAYCFVGGAPRGARTSRGTAAHPRGSDVSGRPARPHSGPGAGTRNAAVRKMA